MADRYVLPDDFSLDFTIRLDVTFDVENGKSYDYLRAKYELSCKEINSAQKPVVIAEEGRALVVEMGCHEYYECLRDYFNEHFVEHIVLATHLFLREGEIAANRKLQNFLIPYLDHESLISLRSKYAEMELRQRERLSIGEQRGGSRRKKADLASLFMFYEKYIEDWREAFKECQDALVSRSTTRQQEWRTAIKRNHPHLSDDLVERLQPMKDWPDEIAQNCSEQGGEDKPEDIALEHAARLCGAADYAYKLSSLRKMYQQQKRAERQNEN